MRKPTSNAVFGYRKSRTGIGSTRTAKLNISANILCIYDMPKPSLLQRIKNWRHNYEFN